MRAVAKWRSKWHLASLSLTTPTLSSYLGILQWVSFQCFKWPPGRHISEEWRLVVSCYTLQPLPGKAPKGKWNVPRSCRRTPLLSRVRDFVKAGAIAPSCLQASPGEWTPKLPTSLPSQVGRGSSPIRGCTLQRGITTFTNLPHSFVTIYCAAPGSPAYFSQVNGRANSQL